MPLDFEVILLNAVVHIIGSQHYYIPSTNLVFYEIILRNSSLPELSITRPQSSAALFRRLRVSEPLRLCCYLNDEGSIVVGSAEMIRSQRLKVIWYGVN